MSFSCRTGCYAVLLNTKCRITYDEEESSQKDVKVLFSNADNQVIQQKRITNKLDCQFGPTGSKRVRKLLTDGNMQEECLFKLLEDLDDVCHICKRFKKPPPKPIVCIPLAKVLNRPQRN